MPIIVAMDGPSGAGKSSTSKAVAKRAGWNYLDTGALYRGATWLAIEKNISNANELIEALLDQPLTFNADPEKPTLKCGKKDITDAIRSEEVTSAVSTFAAMPEVRSELLVLQRKIINEAQFDKIVK